MRIFTLYLLIASCLFNLPGSAQQLIFSDDFNSGSLSSAWQATPGKDQGAARPFKLTQDNYVMRLGKFSDGDEGFVMNRLDLPLKLSSYPRVLLQFDIAHYGEEVHPQDGIYLSNDGGKFFTKMYGFAFDQWVERTMGTMPPLDLVLLAKNKGLSLNDQTVIRFQQYGSHDFIGSAQYSDGIQLDNIEVIAPENTYAALPFKEDFEQKQWHSALSVGHSIDNNCSFSPFGIVETIYYDSLQGHVARLGNQYDQQPTTNALDLHVDLSPQVEVELLFKILSNHEETHLQDGIFFSPDGGHHFTKVFDFDLELWRENEFGAYPPININRLAQQHSIPLTNQFVIRFQQHDDDDFQGSRLTSDGIYLNDIEIREVTTTYATYPFSEDFENAELASYWKISAPNTRDKTVSMTPVGKVQLVSTSDGQALAMGSTADRIYNTNALDLYINLSQAMSPELSFGIRNNFDETHLQDGIYFSQDAGRSFVKVFHFDGSHWASNTWGSFHAMDIKELASKHHLKLSNQFVIRFQQHDDDDFEGTRTVSDGYLLDNIAIQEPPHTYYAKLPFIDTFESDSLAGYWRIGNLTRTADEHLLRPGSSAMIVDTFSYSHPHSLALGRASIGELTTSAYDLHLDLSYQSDLELNFRMYNCTAINRKENGIWISNNGGKSFKQAYRFQSSMQQQYVYHSIDLDSIISELALEYTHQFVIRFQQLSDRSFLGRDGFVSGTFLDDVVVTHPIDAPNVQDIRLNYQEDTRQQLISWPASNDELSFQTQLFMEELSSTHLVEEQTTSTNSMIIADGSLIPNQLHYIRIKASDNFSKSNWSNPLILSSSQEGTISISTLATRLY